jgi:protein-disulfide isomerase
MRKYFTIGMIISGITAIGLAQESSGDLEKDIEYLKQNQRIIIQELETIKKILAPLERPPEIDIRGMEIELAGKNRINKGGPRLVIIEFTDYQCPFCGRFSRDTFPEVRRQYLDNQKIDYAIFDLPLPMHQFAQKAAEATLCAEEQGRYWEMHSHLMENQESLAQMSILAANINMDVSSFEQCLNSGKHADKVAEDIAIAKKLGMTSVPGFILAEKDPQKPSTVRGISAIRGAMPFSHFQNEIDKAMAELRD